MHSVKSPLSTPLTFGWGFRETSAACNNEIGFMAAVVAPDVDETLWTLSENSPSSGTTDVVLRAGMVGVIVVPVLLSPTIES